MNHRLLMRWALFQLANMAIPRNGDLYRDILDGLSIAFPDSTSHDRHAMLRHFLKSYTKTSILSERIENLPSSKRHLLVKRITSVEGGERLDVLKASGRPVLIITPHFGSVVLHITAFAMLWGNTKRRGIVIDSPRRNPDAKALEKLQREEGWETIYADKLGLRHCVRLLKTGGVAAILPDLSSVGKTSLYVPFFGRLVLAMPGAAYLATRTNAILLPVLGWHRSAGRYVMLIDEPFDPVYEAESNDAIYETTAEIYRRLEAIIRNRYAEWAFWPHLARRCVTALAPPSTLEQIPATLRALSTFVTDDPLRQLLSDRVPLIETLSGGSSP